MENSESRETTQIDTQTPQGSTLTQIHTRREVITYALSEGDLDYAGSLNIFAMIFFSVGSAFLSLAVAVWLEMFIGVDLLTNETQFSLRWIKNILLFLCAIAYVLGSLSSYFRYTKLETIKKASKVIQR